MRKLSCNRLARHYVPTRMMKRNSHPLSVARLAVAAFLLCIPLHAEREAPFSLVVGTQVIGPKYQFTDQPALTEMAKAIEELGSDTLKLSVSRKYDKVYHIERDPRIKSVRDLVSMEPSFKAAFDMPFRNIMFWLYPFSDTLKSFRKGSISQAESDQIYREIYDFTAYLLKTYSGSGKSFFIGNWEGDWHTIPGFDAKLAPTPEALEAMRNWLILREKAVSDARRDTAHSGVNVYFYVEINLVSKAMTEDRPSIVNKVLPHIKADFVSYSSYDISNKAMKAGGEKGRKQLFDALDYIEKHLPESDIPGKRVMIGEYGLTLESLDDGEQQRMHTADLMKWGLEWGCPFVLYWELYCNEINERTGEHRGHWLIDDKGVKQPVWHLHREFLGKANAYVDAYRKEKGRLPSQAEYNAAATTWISAERKPEPPVRKP